jgi:hypothetical protein
MIAFISIGRFIAAHWRAAVVALLAVALFAGGWHYGAARVTAQWSAEKQKTAQAVAKVETKQAVVTAKVETKYVDRVQVIREQGKTITQQVVKYVPLSTPALPYGFRVLHDAAATGVQLPSAAGGLDGPAVSAQDVASTVASNYTDCRATAAELTALQEWVRGEQGAAK